MFRILQFKDNQVTGSTDTGEVRLPGADEACWIDIQDFTPEDLELLRRRFGFHPLAIEDCIQNNERAKLDDYGDYLFLVMHQILPIKNSPSGFHAEEVDAFLGTRFLVTVHHRPVAEIDHVWTRAADDRAIASQGMDFLCYLLMDELVDGVFPLLDRFSEHLEQEEGAILARPGNTQMQGLMHLRRMLVMMRRLLAPQRDMVAILVRRGDERISDRTALFFRDIYDHLMRANEELELQRDLIGNAMDAYLSMIANRTNNVMKQLTVLASIFLPLNFLTGFFGQNFEAIPNSSHLLFGLDIFACVAIPLAMLSWFRRHQWY